MARSLIEDAPDMCCKGDVCEEMMGEETLACIGVRVDELLALCRERDVTACDFGKSEHLQRLGDRKEVVDFHVQRCPDNRKIGLAVIGRACDGLEQARQEVR